VRSLKWLFGLGCVLAATSALAERVPPGTDAQIRERLQPFGSLCRAGDDCASGPAATASADSGGAASGDRSGDQIYEQFCGTCHRMGVAGAPVLGDAEAWEPRIAKGMDTLWDHTLNGFNGMPAKGACATCSDDELRAALDYMVDESR
jgi:cytochrome c5